MQSQSRLLSPGHEPVLWHSAEMAILFTAGVWFSLLAITEPHSLGLANAHLKAALACFGATLLPSPSLPTGLFGVAIALV